MKNKILRWIDYRTGLYRGWGLVLYATLPASLAMLNILDIKIGVNDFKIEYLSFAVIPMLVLFLLIRAKQEDWFLDRAYLNIRSILILTTILIISTCICGIALLIKDKYIFEISISGMLDGGFRAFLMAVSSLVVSAALFMSVLSKKTSLPGIPSQWTVDSFAKFRPKLFLIQENKVWKSSDVDQNFPKELLDVVIDLEEDLKKFNLISHVSVKEDILERDLIELKKILNGIKGKMAHAKKLEIEDAFKPLWEQKNPNESLQRIITIKI